ncbi:MAG TPA: DUF3089 domain-containing protein [Bacteroidia bacterium]|nr:DUF3089 domain-containing protein [Bacteroidia bacterium]
MKFIRPKHLPLLFLLAGISCIHPRHAYDHYPKPPAPDYSKPECWASLPSLKDWADSVPANTNLENGEANAQVDVFFIHPTSDHSRDNWNGDVYNAALNHETDHGTIRLQCSVFNESCRIYAPRYRQATLASFTDSVNGPKAIDFAYEDVKTAFEYYLAHYNNGRPFIIASHSQGTRHAVRLLHEFIDNDPVLRKKLVAAYLIGQDVKNDEYKNIPPADSAAQTGCVISWRSEEWGYVPPKGKSFKNMLCVNPLTWTRKTDYAGKEKNHGSVPTMFDRIDAGIADAQIVDGMLWVHKPGKPGYPPFFKTYHLVDYNLFYINLRENIKLRVENYLSQQE